MFNWKLNRKKKVILWTNSIYDLLYNIGKVGGIAIQMNFWAETFVQNGWQVYSFSNKKSLIKNNIIFLRSYSIRYIGFFLEILLSFYYILSIRPNVIFLRGASRSVGYLSLFTKILSVKFVYFGASDSDFMPKEELIKAKHDRILYRRGLKRVKYVIVQNQKQADLLIKNYGRKKFLIIPNIWKKEIVKVSKKDIDVLWVSNIRELKRPEWFLHLAKDNPDLSFIMVGGAYDQKLYKKCEEYTRSIDNLSFLGYQSLEEVNKLFNNAKCFVCTSTMEGFPNTFLQSWSNTIPVLSTFDPGDILKKNELGIWAANYEELNIGLHNLFIPDEYKRIQNNITRYFEVSHNPQKMYKKILTLLT
jgi:Glycosyltransferase